MGLSFLPEQPDEDFEEDVVAKGLEDLVQPEHVVLVSPRLLQAGWILLEEVLASPLDVVLQVLVPVDQRYVEVKGLLVSIRDVRLKLVDVVLLPLPLIDREVLHDPHALVQPLYEPHHELFLPHDPEDSVVKVCGDGVLEHLTKVSFIIDCRYKEPMRS